MTDRVLKAKHVGQWVERVFGLNAQHNIQERVARLLEEAVELAQAEGLSYRVAKRILSSVYTNPAGHPEQELGGVLICSLAYADAKKWDIEVVEKH